MSYLRVKLIVDLYIFYASFILHLYQEEKGKGWYDSVAGYAVGKLTKLFIHDFLCPVCYPHCCFALSYVIGNISLKTTVGLTEIQGWN